MGDRIVIASSSFYAEEVDETTIAAVSFSGSTNTTTITVTDALQFTHLGEVVSVAGESKVLDMRAEVAVLTRNVIITVSCPSRQLYELRARHSNNSAVQSCMLQAAALAATWRTASSRHTSITVLQRMPKHLLPLFWLQGDADSQRFMHGGQVFVNSPSYLPRALIKFDNVEVAQMGQAFRLGRYAIHWHMHGDVANQTWVRGCSIHNSYNRAVTFHGVHQAIVQNNVAFNVMGHTFFIEVRGTGRRRLWFWNGTARHGACFPPAGVC